MSIPGPFDREAVRRLKDISIQASPVILAVIGVLLIVAALSLATPGSTISTILYAVGTTTLSGGIFSAVANARLFSSIYSNLLHDVIYDRKFLATRNDLDEVWRRVSDVLSEQRFPELKSQIDNSILERYFPRNRDFYYSRVERTFRIIGYNKDKNSLECEDICELVINPHKGVPSINYHYQFSPSVGGETSIVELKINGELIQKDGEANTDPPVPGGFERKINLPAKEHTIRRRRITEIPLSPEPYSKVSYKTYVQSLRVHARCDVKDLPIIIRFESIGEELYRQIDVDAEREGRVSIETTRLLMPGEGHILLFVKQEA